MLATVHKYELPVIGSIISSLETLNRDRESAMLLLPGLYSKAKSKAWSLRLYLSNLGVGLDVGLPNILTRGLWFVAN